jgi:nucleoside-diphosphate-sugar epimerase
MTNHRTALVLGATGGIGGEVAVVFAQSGWRVRSLHREPALAARKASHLTHVQWVAGDAMRREDVVAAAEGADVIMHGVNAPGYRNWRGLALPMLESSLAAAKASGARLVFPGTVYNFGPDAFPTLSERSPQAPLTRKGKIRVEMEQRLEAANRDGVRSLVVRAGDFFGPRTGNSWFAQGLVKPGKPVRSILYPGRPDVGHAWAYLPDVAATIAQLLFREAELADFDVFHFGGHWFEPGIEMAHAIQRAVGEPYPPIRRFPGSWPSRRASSSPCSGRCWSCAISGSARSGSTTRNSSHSWTPSRTPRSMRRCAPPWSDWVVCLAARIRPNAEPGAREAIHLLLLLNGDVLSGYISGYTR